MAQKSFKNLQISSWTQFFMYKGFAMEILHCWHDIKVNQVDLFHQDLTYFAVTYIKDDDLQYYVRGDPKW